MEWTAKSLDRLYELYQQHIERLRADVIKSNGSLGSSKPEHTALKCSSRDEFEARLKRQTDDPEVVQLWIRRIVRGHEDEFAQLTFVGGRQTRSDESDRNRPRELTRDSCRQPTARRPSVL